MDQIDKKLLELLKTNSRVPLKKLADEVFLSPPAVAARIEKLQEEKIITGFHVDVDNNRIGYPLTAYVNLSMHPGQRTDFAAYVKKCPNVMECCHVSGPYSMLLKVCFEGTQQLDLFIAKLQEFGTTQTQVVFSAIVKPRNIL